MFGGDVMDLSFYRPQRAAFPGESGPYVDMGQLHYGIAVATNGGSAQCPASDYSDLSSTLSFAAPSQNTFYDAAFPLADSAADAAPSSANELGFTVNLLSCLASNNLPTTGQEINVGLGAADQPRNGVGDSGSQTIDVCLPGCTVGHVQGPGGQLRRATMVTAQPGNSSAGLVSGGLFTFSWWPGTFGP